MNVTRQQIEVASFQIGGTGSGEAPFYRELRLDVRRGRLDWTDWKQITAPQREAPTGAEF